MEDYIHDLLGPVQFDVVTESLRVLQAYGLNNVYPMIEQQLSDETNLDTSGHRGAIYGIIKEHLHDVLLRHGISVTEDAPLTLLNTIAKGLVEIVEDYDPDYILSEVSLTLTDEFPAVNVLAALLEHVYSSDQLVIMDNIVWLDEALIVKIEKALNDKVIPDIPTVDNGRKERYLSFAKGLRTGPVFALIASGLKIGQLDALAIVPYLEDTLAELNDVDLAFELASLLLISTTPITKEAITTLSGLMRETDPEIMTLRVKVVNLLEEYIHDKP